MKTTVKCASDWALVVKPSATGQNIEIASHQPGGSVGWILTPDQAGALIFGIEMAAEAVYLNQLRAAAGTHAAGLQPAGQE